MVDISRILEIRNKGVESATPEDISLIYKMVADYLNIEAQQSIKNLDLRLSINVEGAITNLVKNKGKVSLSKGGLPDA